MLIFKGVLKLGFVFLMLENRSKDITLLPNSNGDFSHYSHANGIPIRKKSPTKQIQATHV